MVNKVKEAVAVRQLLVEYHELGFGSKRANFSDMALTVETDKVQPNRATVLIIIYIRYRRIVLT